MRHWLISLLAFAMAGTAVAQQQTFPDRMAGGGNNDTLSQPVERLGPDDLIGVAVYDSPELTRNVRIESDGTMRLPMLKQRIQAAGLFPAELEIAISSELVKENVLVDPVVAVSVVEYRSRPITVVGEVKLPTTFQATGVVTLLDAISRAGGLADTAGEEILVSEPDGHESGQFLVRRISVHALLSGADQSLNIHLHGGEQIRVPEAGHIFVVGDVKKPGSYQITDGSQSSVLKALALSEGLDSFPSGVAYIYRVDDLGGARKEIRIELKKIMNRKEPDVNLARNDILYVPNATGPKHGLKLLTTAVGVGAGLGAAMIYAYH